MKYKLLLGCATLAAAVVTLAPGQSEAPRARFHHVMLNVRDPQAAADFYTSKFWAEKAKFRGVEDAVWAQKSWLRFRKVAAAPPLEIVSPIWHIGWGAEDMHKEYAKQVASGTKFETPLSDITDMVGGFPFFYAYVQSPDNALIELNTAAHHQFGHLHLLSDDPPAAAEWYVKHFGIRGHAGRGREARFFRGHQISPSASLMMDNVNIILFPKQYAYHQWPDLWRNRTAFESPRGRAIDHVGFSVDDLDAKLKELAAAGVKIIEPAKLDPATKARAAMIEGPDRIAIQIVEGHPVKP